MLIGSLLGFVFGEFELNFSSLDKLSPSKQVNRIHDVFLGSSEKSPPENSRICVRKILISRLFNNQLQSSFEVYLKRFQMSFKYMIVLFLAKIFLVIVVI